MINAVLVDVNGTLFPASAAAAGAFARLGLTEDRVESCFAAVLRDGFAAQLSDNFQPFRHFGGYHLQGLLSAAGKTEVRAEDAAKEVLAAWETADLFPDVAPGIRALQAAGIQVAVLTNGSEAIARGVLGRGGVGNLVEPVLDIEAAQAWKPAREAYQFALSRLGLPASQVMMVAAHPWDIQGALQAGLQAAYVQRSPHEPYPPFFSHLPQLVVESFEELASKLGAAGT